VCVENALKSIKGIDMSFHLVAVQKYKPKREGHTCNSTEKKNDQKDASKQCSFISKNQCSQGIFLPKEWTY